MSKMKSLTKHGSNKNKNAMRTRLSLCSSRHVQFLVAQCHGWSNNEIGVGPTRSHIRYRHNIQNDMLKPLKVFWSRLNFQRSSGNNLSTNYEL